MKIVIIFLLTLTSHHTRAKAIRQKTEIQRQLLDGLVRLITKRSFPPLLQEIKKYFKKDDVFRKLITDVVIWKSDMIKRVFKMVRDKVDAVESVLWLLFKTTNKPKGRPQWEWLDSQYDWSRRWRGRTKSYGGGNQNYNNNNGGNGDYNNRKDDAGDDGGDEGDGGDDDDDDGGGDDGGDNGGERWS